MKCVYSTDLCFLFPPCSRDLSHSAAFSFFTLTFSLKQDHRVINSKSAKRSFIEINNGRDFAVLVKPTEWFLFAAHPGTVRAFPNRPECRQHTHI
jgi:hypothetical protein